MRVLAFIVGIIATGAAAAIFTLAAIASWRQYRRHKQRTEDW